MPGGAVAGVRVSKRVAYLAASVSRDVCRILFMFLFSRGSSLLYPSELLDFTLGVRFRFCCHEVASAFCRCLSLIFLFFCSFFSGFLLERVRHVLHPRCQSVTEMLRSQPEPGRKPLNDVFARSLSAAGAAAVVCLAPKLSGK